MEHIPIETGIPIPKGKPTERKFAYPFSKMQVGESFFVPKTDSSFVGVYRTRLAPKKFTTRVEEVDGIKGVRVWRVE